MSDLMMMSGILNARPDDGSCPKRLVLRFFDEDTVCHHLYHDIKRAHVMFVCIYSHCMLFENMLQLKALSEVKVVPQ